MLGAHLHLAELYLRARTKLAEDWPGRTESLLKRVLELSPPCRRALFLLGSLYADPLVSRPGDAEIIFSKLEDNADACLFMAQTKIAKGDVAPAPTEALEWLCRHIALASSFSSRASELVALLLPRNLEVQQWNRLAELLQALEPEVSDSEMVRISETRRSIDHRSASKLSALGAGTA